MSVYFIKVRLFVTVPITGKGLLPPMAQLATFLLLPYPEQAIAIRRRTDFFILFLLIHRDQLRVLS